VGPALPHPDADQAWKTRQFVHARRAVASHKFEFHVIHPSATD
jgi:hypothetical protein